MRVKIKGFMKMANFSGSNSSYRRKVEEVQLRGMQCSQKLHVINYIKDMRKIEQNKDGSVYN